MGVAASPVHAQQGTSIDSLAYRGERNRLREAQEAHLQALRARLAQQAASQGSVSANALTVTFTVNTTDDVDDGTCDGVHCSLREAIHAANATTAEDEIAFNIGGGGVKTIVPTSALPAITQPVILDGTTQPGHVANPIIELNGTGAGLTADGLVITGAGSTIRGLVIRLFKAPGIVLDGAEAFDNHIEGNFIGTDISGINSSGNGFAGILIQNGAHDNVIGDTTAEARNVISGNVGYGVLITNNTTTANRVEGNFIGTNATGTSALGNGNDGVRIDAGPDANVIGGAMPGAGNVLSGNGADGVEIHGGTSTDNRIEGNFIGTNVAGTAAIPNNHQGVVLQVNTFNNVVGGTVPGAGNLISGNNLRGVYLNHVTTSGNRIEGNRIGTDVTGTLDLGNGRSGVYLIFDTFDNAIGGMALGAGNVIAFNSLGGVILTSSAGTSNAILGNRIFENSNLGIDLGGTFPGGGNGATPNDPGDGDASPNKLQNFPVLSDALIINNNDLLVTYLVDTDLVNASYPLTVEFFKADVDNEEGQTFLGRDVYTTADHGGCGPPPCAKTVNLGNGAAFSVMPADHLVATATDDDGNTSEFSTPLLAESFLVTNTNDSGTGSLRQALLNANAHLNDAEPDTIDFDIHAQTDPGCDNGTGVCTIAVQSVLPTITEAVVIDGETQAGADCGSSIPSRTLKIVVDGSAIGVSVDGFTVTGSGSTIRALVINQFQVIGTFQSGGILLTGSGSVDNVIACNFIGTDVTGTLDQGNNLAGVLVVAGASNNTIGGTTPDAGNLISANFTGVFLRDMTTSGNVVQGNYIGTDAGGTADLGNTQHGVLITSAANNTIGGTAVDAANTIAFNGQDGVALESGTGNATLSNSIFENTRIGIDLGTDGPTPNDPGDSDASPNNLQNFPDLTDALIDNNGDLLLVHFVDTDLTTATYPLTVELFLADADDEEGQAFLGRDAYATTDHGDYGAPPCEKIINLGSAAALSVAELDQLVATATDDEGNTSEFSAPRVVGKPDLAATKTFSLSLGDDGIAEPDETISYAVEVSNTGTSRALDVRFVDLVDDNTTLVLASVMASQGTDNSTGNTIDIDIGVILTGQTVTISFDVVVDDPVTAVIETITNQGIVSGANFIDVLTDNPDTPQPDDPTVTEIDYTAEADLALTKEVDNDEPDFESNVVYTLTIINNGPSEPASATVKDALPSGLIYVSHTGDGAFDPATNIWTTPDIGYLDTAEIMITAKVKTVVPTTNTACITKTSLLDPDESNNCDDATLTPVAADLALTKNLAGFSSDPATNNITVPFKLFVTNNGPSDATGVMVEDPLPEGATLLSASATYDSTTGIWTIGALKAGETALITLLLIADAANNLVNIAQVYGDQPDQDPSNNLAGSQAQHDSPDLDRFVADLSLTKTVSEERPSTDETITYTLVVKNNGPSATAGVIVLDTLTAGLAFVRASFSDATDSYDLATGRWEVGPVKMGQTATLVLEVRVVGTGKIVNTAEIIENHLPDRNGDNDIASAAINVSSSVQATALEDEAVVPEAFSLHQNYPNPFNPQTVIEYALPEATAVRIVVSDMLGREVTVLVDDRLPAGRHEAVFEAGELPSGLYVYRLEGGAQTITRYMLLLK